MLEKTLEKDFKAAVESLDGLFIKFNSSTTGVPDRLVAINGQLYLLEFKSKYGRPSPRQVLVHKQFAAAGVTVQVVYPASAWAALSKICGGVVALTDAVNNLRTKYADHV